MKMFLNSKSLVLLVVMLTFGVTLNAQRRYHRQRVKVNAETVTPVKVNEDKAPVSTVTPVTETVVMQEEVAVINENTTGNVTVASTDAEVNVVKAHKNTVGKVADVKVKTNKKIDLASFTQKLLKHDGILKVQDIKKTNLETWVMIMIILYAAGVLFLILALIFLFATVSYGGYLAFIILAILCLLGASIVLTLGLVGVF